MFNFFVLLFLMMPSYGESFDWQGHRGARGLYPENTIGSMREALRHPVTTLELDVIISKDGEVVVSHEPWFNEEICLGSKNKNLYQMTYAEIAAIDCGSKAHLRFPQQKKVKESKPLLRTLIKTMEREITKQGRDITYNIEIKSSAENEKKGFQPEHKIFTDKVLALTLSLLPSRRFLIQSFDWRVLKYIHAKYPGIRVVALRETAYTPQGVIEELGFSPEVFSPDATMLKAKDVAYFHQKGVKVIAWTVNDPDEMKKLIDMKVDGIITDYPNLIIAKCPRGYNEFEGRCVKLPAHALPSDKNPGWRCKEGHWQKRNKCPKMDLPAHSVLSEDGMSWVCKEGYKRYRGKCIKF